MTDDGEKLKPPLPTNTVTVAADAAFCQKRQQDKKANCTCQCTGLGRSVFFSAISNLMDVQPYSCPPCYEQMLNFSIVPDISFGSSKR